MPSYRRRLAGLFLLSMAVLVLEITLTRLFAVVIWSHLTPIIVGSALFGFSLSGLYARFFDRPRSPGTCALLFAVGVILTFITASTVPLRLWNYEAGTLQPPWIALFIYYVVLLLPFFGAGLGILRLLSGTTDEVNRLYAADLAGAAMGCVAVAAGLPLLFGEGMLVASAALGCVAAVLLAERSFARLSALLAAAACAGVATVVGVRMPLLPDQAKREYVTDMRSKPLLHTGWTAMSRVDVTAYKPDIYKIWIDGGTYESSMFHNLDLPSGDGHKGLRPGVFLPHWLLRGSDARVLVVGPAGGTEVAFALATGAAHVDAVEMDVGVFRAVRDLFDGFINGIYHDPRVAFVNDEARSFVRRSAKRYDLIQSVNNNTSVALLSGALNLSESFLLTKEAFNDYLDHLTDRGMIAFHRTALLRMAALGAEVLQERGVAEPGRHLIVLRGERFLLDTFLLKRSPFTSEEIAAVKSYATAQGLGVLYSPGGEGEPLYREIVESPDRSRFYRSLGVDLEPPVDDAPFFEHYVLYGHHPLDPSLPPEFAFFDRFKLWGLVPHGDIAYVVILVESAVLATVLVGWPLWLDRGGKGGRLGLALYFAGLGAGFILIELCLMKSVVLFLGHPGYSISVVLFTLLAGAAIGSFASARLSSPRAAISILVALMLLEIVAMPIVFRHTLGLEFAGRVGVAILLLLPLAISMGMPFPVAFRILQQHEPGAQPLAWAMNGYGTVLGSGLCVFLAVFLGFRATYLVACAIYLVAAVAFPARRGSASA